MPEPIPTTNEELMREFFDTNSLAEHIPPEEWQGVETEDDDEDVTTEPQAAEPGAGGMSDAERAFVGASEIHVKPYMRGGHLVSGYVRSGMDVAAEAVNVDYRGQHTAPDSDFGASLDQIDRMVTDNDFYNHLHHYYDGGQSNPTRADLESAAAIRSARGKPDMKITIYRAVPPGVDEINGHDWVTLSKAYAREHIESNGEPDWKIISRKVPVRELWWDANSISEFGWVPGAQAGVNMAADWQEMLHPRGRGGRFRAKPKFFDYVSDTLHKGDVVSMENRPDEPTFGRMDLIEEARSKGTLWDQVGKYSAADIMRVHGQLPEWAPSIHWDYGSDDHSYFIAPWEEPGSRVRGKPPRKFNDPMIGMHPLLVYPDMYKRGGVGSEDFDGKAQIKQQHKHIEGILNHELGHYMDYQILSRMAGTDIGGNLMQRMNSLAEVSEAIVRENRDGEDLGFDNVLGEVLDSLMSQDLVMRGLEKPDEHLSNDELISRYKERVVSTGMPDVFQAIEDSDWRKGVNDMLDGDWITENIIKPVYQTQGTTTKGYLLADQISHYTDYLGSASEEWAQAYQQFVAEFLAREFGDDRLRKDMIADAKERAKAKMGPGAKTLGISQEVMDRVAKIHARRWDDDDFEPIYQAMYRMFDHAGMLNGLRGQQKLFAERS